MKDCGAACILMIMKYYGGYININRILTMSKTNREGTTLYHIKNTLEQLGFVCEGVSCDINNLFTSKILMPCICNCIIDNSYKHFIVIYEVCENYLIVGDPSYGIKKITKDKFKSIYNSTLLLIRPNQIIPYISDNKVYTYTKIVFQNKKAIGFIVCYSLIITLLSIFFSFYFGNLIDNLGIGNNILDFIFIVFFFINLIKYFLEILKLNLLSYLNKKIDLNLTVDILKNILNLPYQYYKNHTSGDILSRVNDISNIKDILNKIILFIFIDFPLIILSLIILFRISFTLSIIILFLLLIIFLLTYLLKNINYKILYNLKLKQAISTSSILDAINSYETVKGLNIEEDIHSSSINKYIHYLNYSIFSFKFFSLQNYFIEFINSLIILITMYKGSAMINNNQLVLSQLITFNTVSGYFMNSTRNMIDTIMNYNQLKSSLNRINELFEEGINKGFISIFSLGSIVVKNLDFTFNDKKYVLKNINLKIDKQNKVLIIGKNGSGKSTLLKILKVITKLILIKFILII